MAKIKEVVGERFGRLVVVSENHITGQDRRVECQCDCGNVKSSVLLSHLRSGKIVSCGCFRLERVAETNRKLNTKHGMYGTRPYSIWSGIMDRTLRCAPTSKYWDYYAGRGITCNDKWKTFEGFWEDMQEGYSDELEIDRIDVNKGYYKDNCRWVTNSLQSYNKRRQKRNSSGRTGVMFDKSRSKWVVEISKDCVTYYIGRFENFEDAVKAREEAELEYYGEVKIE